MVHPVRYLLCTRSLNVFWIKVLGKSLFGKQYFLGYHGSPEICVYEMQLPQNGHVTLNGNVEVIGGNGCGMV